jgi:hypothetical protein
MTPLNSVNTSGMLVLIDSIEWLVVPQSAPHAALLSELGLSASPAEMAFSDRAAECRRLCERADVF